MMRARPSASSGVISGSGFAKAKTIGSLAIRSRCSVVSTPGTERPKKRSAPSITSQSSPVNPSGLVFSATQRSMGERSSRSGWTTPLLSRPMMFFMPSESKLLVQPLLDLETPGGRDVLQVYAAEARGYVLYRGYDVLGIRTLQADRVSIHVSELLEEHRLALHHRHCRLWPHLPEPQNRRPVGDYRDGVSLYGEVERLRGVFSYRLAHPGDPRRVGHRERVPRFDRHLGLHLYLATHVGEKGPV